MAEKPDEIPQNDQEDIEMKSILVQSISIPIENEKENSEEPQKQCHIPENDIEMKSVLVKSESISIENEKEKSKEEDIKDLHNNYEDHEQISRPSVKGLDFHDLDFFKSYAKEYKQITSKFEEEYKNPEILEFFLLSKLFLKEWKVFVGYEEIQKDALLPKGFGKAKPSPFNEDLIDQKESLQLLECEGSDCIALKEGLKENHDFEIVSKETMEFFEKNFHGQKICRKAYILPDGHKRIEIYYKRINVIAITHSTLKDSENNYNMTSEFSPKNLQVFSQKTLKDLKEILLEIVNNETKKRKEPYSYNSYYTTYKSEQLRFWKLDPEVSLSQAYEYVRKVCRSQNTYDYRIEMKGKFLDNDSDMKLGDLNLNESEYLILEVREESKGWNFTQEGIPNMEKCEYCNRYEKLTSYCVCKKVGYCNEECRFKDRRFHSMKCDKADEEEEEKESKFTEESRFGLTGLSNLGNTCFMNSALQCVSNTYGLVKYFIEKRFIKEINLDNPLGSKGKLTQKYWGLIRNLWINKNSVYSPYGIKNAVAQINSIFSGYNQHDSHEFLSFLLDGLHEDLNRVKKKPYTETIESDGRPDRIVARESWLNHLKRNDSIITDLMHGQYRSEITCPNPDCKHVSITFDPFLTCTLPIPTKKEKKIDFYFLFNDNRVLTVKMEFSFIKEKDYIGSLKTKCCEKIALKYPNLTIDPNSFSFYFLGNSTCTKIDDKSLTNDVKKKHKIYNLFAVQRNKELLTHPEEEIYDIPITMCKKESNYSSYYSKRQFSFIHPLSFLLSDTTNQIHLRIFHYFRFLFEEYFPVDKVEEKEEFMKLNDIEAYAQLFGKPDERPYEVLISTNSRGYYACYFCGESKCENCKLSDKDDETLKDLLSKIKNKDFTFELEIYFPSSSFDGYDLGKRFSKYDSLETGEKKEEEEEKSINKYYSSYSNDKSSSKGNEEKNIYECFELFQATELLTKDNMWYCSKCKTHQEAQKEMRIYKVPQFLAIHLKRFKGGSGFFSSGIISTKVSFPVQLDLSKYVLNHELPTTYLQEPQLLEKSEKLLNGKLEAKEPLIYNLYAISNHYGSASCGHYTAFGKNAKKDEWYCFDDSSVSRVSEESIVTSSAYILFYERSGVEKNCVFDVQNTEPELAPEIIDVKSDVIQVKMDIEEQKEEFIEEIINHIKGKEVESCVPGSSAGAAED